MDIETLREYCLTFADVEETFPFDDVSLVFKVKGKMFLLLPLDAPEWVSMKCATQNEPSTCGNGMQGLLQPGISTRNIGIRWLSAAMCLIR